MNYKQVIEDYNNGTIDKETIILVMDNDGGYWSCTDNDMSEEKREDIEETLKKKYGSPGGYDDIVDVLVAAGVNSEWC